MTDAEPMPGTIAACRHCRMMIALLEHPDKGEKWEHLYSLKEECDALPPIGWGKNAPRPQLP